MTPTQTRKAQRLSGPWDKSQFSHMLLNVVVVLTSFLMAFLVYLSVTGEPQGCAGQPCIHAGVVFMIGFLLVVTVLAIIAAHPVALARHESDFLLLRRRFLGRYRIVERIPAAHLTRVLLIVPRQRGPGPPEPTGAHLELVDGRRIGVSRELTDEATWRTLAEPTGNA